MNIRLANWSEPTKVALLVGLHPMSFGPRVEEGLKNGNLVSFIVHDNCTEHAIIFQHMQDFVLQTHKLIAIMATPSLPKKAHPKINAYCVALGYEPPL